MNRIDRLFAILLVLQTHRTVRASDIAERFEITERTVYRDISALIQMGVPLVSLPGVGYQMMDGFYLPPLVFTPEEASAMYLGAAMIAASGNFSVAAGSAIGKLDAALPERIRRTAKTLADMIEFYLPKSEFHLETPHLVQLRDAVQHRLTLKIRYHSRSENMITEREVDPYGITRSQSAWYFYGYCHLRQDMRSFRLDRVESLIVTRKSFSIRDTIDAGTRLNDQQIIELRVKPKAVRWVRERQHYAFVSEETIGQNTIMTYQVKEFTEIRAWILAWGASVEVLKPVVLRDEIFSEVEAILQFRNSSETS